MPLTPARRHTPSRGMSVLSRCRGCRLLLSTLVLFTALAGLGLPVDPAVGTAPTPSATTTDRTPAATAGRTSTAPAAGRTSATPTPPRRPRIVGGAPVPPGAYPFAAFIETVDQNGAFSCDGTLIAPAWVLTAAHCAYTTPGEVYATSAITVTLGRVDIRDTSVGEVHQVSQVVPHPGYNPVIAVNGFNYDVALLRLATPSALPPVPLLQPGEAAVLAAPGTSATVIGWGRTSEGGPASDVLNAVEIQVLDEAFCLANYGTDGSTQFNPATMLCAGVPEGGKDACKGDSGGPLLVRNTPNTGWIQAGIVSFSRGCARPGFPTVYTRVVAMLDFIGATIASPPPPPSLPTATATPTAAGTPLGNLALVGPVRIVDTRPAPDGPIGYTPTGGPIGAAPLAPGSVTRFLVAGRSFGGIAIPASATGVLLNVTLVQGGAGGGFVTVYPGDGAGDAPPGASTVNPSLPISANFTAVRLGADGTLAVYSVGAARDIVIDLVGYYSPANPASGTLRLVTPVRVLDTRPTDPVQAIQTIGYEPDGTPIKPGQVPANTVRRFGLAGRSFGSSANAITFPATTSGALVHVTVVSPSGTGGFVTLLPGDATAPSGTSTVNPASEPGITVAFNGAATRLPTAGPYAGTFGIYSTAPVDVIVDVLGYYAPDPTAPGSAVGDLALIRPVRAVDTRPTNLAEGVVTTGFTPAGAPIEPRPLAAGETRRFGVAGRTFAGTTIPADAKGLLLNVTVVQPGGQALTREGFVTVFPGNVVDAGRPTASTLNPATRIAASFWLVGLAPAGGPDAGSVAVYSTGQLDLAVDIVGYVR